MTDKTHESGPMAGAPPGSRLELVRCVRTDVHRYELIVPGFPPVAVGGVTHRDLVVGAEVTIDVDWQALREAMPELWLPGVPLVECLGVQDGSRVWRGSTLINGRTYAMTVHASEAQPEAEQRPWVVDHMTRCALLARAKAMRESETT